HTFSGFTLSVCQLNPESRGVIRPKSIDPLAAPAIHPNYLSTPHDRATTVAGIRLARRIAATRALSPYIAGEYLPGAATVSDDEILEFAKNKGATIFHPAGTCKMGPASDPHAVVYADARLRTGPYVGTVLASLEAAGLDVAIYDEVSIEPTDASFQHAARFAVEGRFDGYVSVGGGSVMDTCKAANLYATHPAEFMT